MSEIENKFKFPARYKERENCVWEEYAELTEQYEPIDLGQGCSDFEPPPHIVNALSQANYSTDITIHQYTRGCGHPRLVKVLAKLYSSLIGQKIDPYTEVLISIGAYEALYCSIMGLVDVGDEVIIIEPFFDCYDTMVRYAGGISKFIPLRNTSTEDISNAADWFLDQNELENLFNSKTKAIILNNPNNPVGKVYSRDDLEKIAELCKKWNVLCISDEVYEWHIYQPYQHIRIASLPGMWERTITIGSAGKTFCITGWKIGWAYAPKFLMDKLHFIHINSVSNTCTILQEAIAIGFEMELTLFNQRDSHFKVLAVDLERKRDFMVEFLCNSGMKPIIPNGGLFMLADWSPLESLIDLSSETDSNKDFRFTKWLIKHIGVQGIPHLLFIVSLIKCWAKTLLDFVFLRNLRRLLPQQMH